jgi:nicotinate-nucleotide adenylyltransferase
MKIALFGGRFDPIHNGHLAVAKEVLKTHSADEVWFSLENQHQWRPIVASVADRLTMLQFAIEGEEKFKIDQTPIALGGLTETISVVRVLRKKNSHDILFVAGSDQLESFHKWTHWEELEKEVIFLIVARKNSPIENVPKNCIIIDDPNYEPLEDSATRIREFVKEGKSISGFVPKKVEQYIKDHKLYR